VTAGKPAALAGIQAGDSIVAVNGVHLPSWDVLLDRIGASAGVPVTLEIIRKGQPLTVRVTPAAEMTPDPHTGQKKLLGRIGVAATAAFEPVSFIGAFGEAWRLTLDDGGKIFSTLRLLLSSGAGVSDLGGPIAIAQVSVQAARSGVQSLFALIALISINLAIFNLLPIPILDGGQIVINVAETIKGSAFSTRTRERILRGGLLLIGLLFVTVMFNDISRNMQSIVHLVGRIFGRSA
jgi:regulator of sigma E protease